MGADAFGYFPVDALNESPSEKEGKCSPRFQGL